MSPVQKALWFVESHSRMGIDLEQVARASCVSQYHLTRAFAEVFGVSLMRYVRLRRLSESARQLAAGAPDILSLALDNGYGSHEAFSRAFRKNFGVTPESVRSIADLSRLNLTEPLIMNTAKLPRLNPPRVEHLPATTLVGLVERYNRNSPAGIPHQWERFKTFLLRIRHPVSHDAYGVCFNLNEVGDFDYMSGVVVTGAIDIPNGLLKLDLPAQKYAVFHHGGHIAEIRSVIAAIWSGALSESGHEPVSMPYLTKVCPDFDGRTGLGSYEVWIAVK